MLFTINEEVYLNGYILTNRYPYGNIGINDVKKIFTTNLKGLIYKIEYPSFINGGVHLYTVKIFDNLYGIEITENKISKYPKTILDSTKTRLPIMINPNVPIMQFARRSSSNRTKMFEHLNPLNPLNPSNPFNPLNPSNPLDSLNPLKTIEQYNTLNFINNAIQAQNQTNDINNLNASHHIQKSVSKHYYYKLVDEWLYKKLFPLLAFVETVNGTPQLIKSMLEYSVEKISALSDEDIKKRVKYLKKNIITKKLVKKILKKMINRMCLNWYDLNEHEETIKKVFLEYFKNLLEEVIKTI